MRTRLAARPLCDATLWLTRPPPLPPPSPARLNSKYLHTLVVKDEEKANKLKQSLPPGLPRTDLPSSKKA